MTREKHFENIPEDMRLVSQQKGRRRFSITRGNLRPILECNPHIFLTADRHMIR